MSALGQEPSFRPGLAYVRFGPEAVILSPNTKRAEATGHIAPNCGANLCLLGIGDILWQERARWISRLLTIWLSLPKASWPKSYITYSIQNCSEAIESAELMSQQVRAVRWQ